MMAVLVKAMIMKMVVPMTGVMVMVMMTELAS